MRTRTPRDQGFSLVETLTSIAIMGVVMTALTTFFVSTTNTVNKERGLQMAIRLASDGVELVKSMPGPSLVSGRSPDDVAKQLEQLAGKDPLDKADDLVPALDVHNLFSTMTSIADTALKVGQASVNPVLPLREQLTVNNTTFTRWYVIGSCGMDPALRNAPCILSSLLSNPLSFLRVVVAVTWQNTRACTGGRCSYFTDTLVAGSTIDPVFNPAITVTPPLPDNPGNQVSELSVPIAPLTLTATTAYPPITWSAENLPPGLTITDAGVISGTPTTAGTYVVRVVVKDKAASNDASFNWVVNPLPTVPQPPDQTWDAGSQVSYTLVPAGGTGPYTWAATGLPAGLTLAAATGAITGSSTATGAAATATVKATVTDKYGKTAAATFKWNTRAAVQYPNANTPIALTKGSAYSGSVVSAGGSGSYTYSSANMPAGLTLSASGAVTGTVTSGTRFLVTVAITDTVLKTTTSVLVPVNVTVPAPGLRITSPSTSSPDKTSPKGTAITAQTVAAAGGTGPYTWAATTLPPGIAINTTTGTMTGTPTTAGTYVVVLTVTDAAKATSTFAFVWKVT